MAIKLTDLSSLSGRSSQRIVADGNNNLTLAPHQNIFMRVFKAVRNSLSGILPQALRKRIQAEHAQNIQENQQAWSVLQEQITALYGSSNLPAHLSDSRLNNENTPPLTLGDVKCIVEREKILKTAFSALTKALTPDQPRINMLDALYQVSSAAKLYSKPVDISRLLEDMNHEEVRALLDGLMSHPWTQEMITFTPILTTGQGNHSIHLKNAVNTLVDTLHGCTARLDDDKKQQVNSWVSYYSNPKYSTAVDTNDSYDQHPEYIDRKFYADLHSVLKKRGIDLKKSMPLPTAHTSMFKMDKPGVLFEELTALYRSYQYNVQQHGLLPLTTVNQKLADTAKKITAENNATVSLESLKDGLNEGFVLDMTRAMFSINNVLLTKSANESENIAAFKQLVPDPAQQTLISYFTFQSIFAGALKKFNTSDKLVGGRTGHIIYRINSDQEGNVKLTATNYTGVTNINSKGIVGDTPRVDYLKLQIELDLKTLKGTLSYQLVPVTEPEPQ